MTISAFRKGFNKNNAHHLGLLVEIHGSQCQQILSIPLILIKAPLLSYSENRGKLSTVLCKSNTSCTVYITEKVTLSSKWDSLVAQQ